MPALKGAGLLKGLGVTFRTMSRRSATAQYPHVRPDLPARSRGVIALVEENCTVCMLCSRECPDWCIYIDSHKETVAPKEGGRARTRNILDRFAIDFGLCMYCGICVEVCPFDALFWSPEYEYSEPRIADLLHDKDKLGEWMAMVAGAIGVVTNRNIIHAALSLVVVMGGAAAQYVLLAAEFVAVTQVLVYI